MDEQFHFQPAPPLLGAVAPSPTVDEAYYNGVCAGLSFRSLLTTASLEPASESCDPLKMPKTEPFYTVDECISAVVPPYNFFPEATSSPLQYQLPNLLSFEQSQKIVEFPMLNPRVETASYERRPRRRQPSRLSDKTKRLQKLLPWDKKMDMATVLEEAHKYIKFLQAQISVLQSMPYESTVTSTADAAATTLSIGGADLGRLNRQQLIQVVINSPVAQAKLYSKECCLYSVEQLAFLKKNLERKALHLHMALGSSLR